MNANYNQAISKELNRLDLTFHTDGMFLKNYWCRIAMNEKKTFSNRVHAHSFYEIHFCLKGWAKFRVDGKEYVLSEGEVAYIPKNKTHQIYDISEDFEKIVWGYDLISDGTMQNELVKAHCVMKEFVIKKYEEDVLMPFYLIINNIKQKKLNWFENVKLYLYCFLTELVRILSGDIKIGDSGKSVAVKSGIELETAKLYILDNLQNGVTVKDLARQMALSERQLFRLCYREFGVSVGDYIKQLQMEKAKSLLEETELTIGEIAEKVGYSDRFAFSKAFTSYEGMTPAKFRVSLKI